MTARLLAFALTGLALAAAAAWAAEDIAVGYALDGEIHIGPVRPALRLDRFGDARGLDDPRTIAPGFRAEAPLADLARDAIAQGFAAGGVALVESGEDMTVAGEVTSVQARRVERDGAPSIELTLRVRVRLEGRGRTVWESILFGRGTAPAGEGIAAAARAALDRAVRELFRDDYFLIELR